MARKSNNSRKARGRLQSSSWLRAYGVWSAPALVCSLVAGCGTNDAVEKPNEDDRERTTTDESSDAGRFLDDAAASPNEETTLDANVVVAPRSSAGGPDAGELPQLSSEDWELLRTLRYDPSPPPIDPSNAVADDVRARRFGQQLFFDPSLSGPLLEGDNDGGGGTLGQRGEAGRVSCASCHVPKDHFVDTRSPHRQISLAALWTKRRTPTLLEVATAPLYNWDGRRDSLWGQAIGVMESEREFNSSRLFIAQQVVANYRDQYSQLFGEPPPVDDSDRFPSLSAADTGCSQLTNQDGVYYECRGKPGDNGLYDALPAEDQTAVTEVVVNTAKAIAAYVRQLRCGEGRFDAWLDGDTQALSASEQRGAALFVGKAKCIDCHSGPNLTDGQFHNVGLRPGVVAVAFTDTDDRGAALGLTELLDDPLNTRGGFSDGDRGVIPSNVEESTEGAFRTPTLRCNAAQPSFMHTGQLTSLESVVAFFSRGGDPAGGYPGVNELSRSSLSESEQADLVAFLGTFMGAGPDPALLALPSQAPTSSDANCGFADAAFCETFEGQPATGGRSGELDATKFSGIRGMPSLHPDLEQAFPIGPALVENCRADLDGTLVGPDRDALLCSPNHDIPSQHLMLAAAAQNYGMTSYRIRQPFDFADRIGTINLDVDLTANLLGGWPAIVLSEDPTPAPTFNFPERGSGPRNGLAVEFYVGSCNNPNSIVPLVYTYSDYVETTPEVNTDCGVPQLVTKPGALNRLSLRVGEGQLEVWGWDASVAGQGFGDPVLLHSQALALPFTRGYLNLVVRNHATIKYWAGSAWFTRWDNVGFDGPKVEETWEYSVPDRLTQSHGSDGCELAGQCVWRGEVMQRVPDDSAVCIDEARLCDFDVTYHDAGYVVPGVDEEPLSLRIEAVNIEGATSAKLVLAVDYPWFEWNDVFPAPTAFNLRYHVNDGAWHDRFVDDVEANAFAGDPDEGPGAGLLNQVIDLDLAELNGGDNAVEFVLEGAWTGAYRAALLGVDLVLSRGTR